MGPSVETLSWSGSPRNGDKHRPPDPFALPLSNDTSSVTLNSCHSYWRHFASQYPLWTWREKHSYLKLWCVQHWFGSSLPIQTCALHADNGVEHLCAVLTWELSACKQTDKVANVPDRNHKKSQMKPMGWLICFQLGTVVNLWLVICLWTRLNCDHKGFVYSQNELKTN